MTSEQIHFVVKDGGRGAIARLRPDAVLADLVPHVCLEVVLVQIVPIVAVIATKDVHVFFIHDT